MKKLVIRDNKGQSEYTDWSWNSDERQYVTADGHVFPVEVRNGRFGWDIVAAETVDDEKIVVDYSEARVSASDFIAEINRLKKAGQKYTAYFYAAKQDNSLSDWSCSLWLGDWVDHPIYGYGITRTQDKEESLKVLKALGSEEQLRGFWDESLSGFTPSFNGVGYVTF